MHSHIQISGYIFLRDIAYLSCIKGMRTKPGITLILLGSLQIHTKKLVDIQNSLLWGATQFRLVEGLPLFV